MSDNFEYVVVRRTVTVETWVKVTDYQAPVVEGEAPRNMTEQQIYDYEAGMPDEDAFEQFVETVQSGTAKSVMIDTRVAFTLKSPPD